ncbi:MAG TPA: toll/interleukin-1 receptor domain-containing protein [Alloacidobacterium sp.]|nr:toll/interleukin-1 receptor domain-containing protein [Alloacidobacterium sp.]
MAPNLFFSYSHVDETLRNQLEVHLATLKRQDLIATWHDRRITAGTPVGDAIDRNLNASQIILLLVSSDFIASDYCYEREMARAIERHEKGDARVIPIILRPCDWHDLPFGKLLAVPRDGKPITTWANIDEAFLDVERAIKAAVKELGEEHKLALSPSAVLSKPVWMDDVSESLGGQRSSNLRVKKEFTDLDRDRFRHDGFEFIARFFENSMQELVKRNPGIDQRFQRVDATHFTAALYQHGQKVCKGSASIAGGSFSSESIEYVMDDNPRHGGMNEAVSVKADDQTLYFQSLGMQSYGRRDKEKLSPQGAAELFWDLFIQPLQ